MKKMFSLLVVALMAATATFAQSAAELAKQQAELRAIHMKMLNAKPTKAAKKEAKELKKDGWTIPAGDLPMEQQITRGHLLAEEYMPDEDGNAVKRYIQHSAIQTGGTYNAAYAAARANVQVELATLIKSQIAAAMQAKLDNAQASGISATTVDKFNQRSRAIVDEALTNAISVLVIYRRLQNNNFEVQVRLAFDKRELQARLKRNLQRELEQEGDQLDSTVQDVICTKF